MDTNRAGKRNYRRVILLGILFLLVVVTVVARLALNYIEQSSTTVKKEAPSAVHVLVMGVDRRDEDVGRSDTLMLVTLDEQRQCAAVLSIPRDTRVYIDGHGYDKINAAYAYGGEALTQKTVERLLNVKVDHHILLDVRSFSRIIDELGGVDVDVEKRMYYVDPWDDDGGLVIDFYPGMQHMNGQKAMEYVRFRDEEGDIGRIARQQKFCRALLKKVLSPETLPKVPAVIREGIKSVETDLSTPEAISLLQAFGTLSNGKLTSDMLPGRPLWYKGISYWIPDILGARKLLAEEGGEPFDGQLLADAENAEAAYERALPKEFLEEDKTQKPNEISVRVVNESGIAGAGASVATALEKRGFIIRSIDNGKTTNTEQTTIHATKGNIALFYGMPFPCILMEGEHPGTALVTIGKDFARREQNDNR